MKKKIHGLELEKNRKLIDRNIEEKSNLLFELSHEVREPLKKINEISYNYKNTNSVEELQESLKEIIKTLCGYKGVEILEGDLMPDHVHLLLSIPPSISISNFMGYLKGKSALMMFDRHANLKYKFGNRRFWAEGYYVSTVGLNEETIRKYIREQEKHDIALDKLSVKEYEDPFTK